MPRKLSEIAKRSRKMDKALEGKERKEEKKLEEVELEGKELRKTWKRGSVKLTEETIDLLCKEYELGLSLKLCCAIVGITPKTLSNWLALGNGEEPKNGPRSLYYKKSGLHETLVKRLKKARAKRESGNLRVIHRVARGGEVFKKKVTTDENGNTIVEEQRTPPNWQAAAWMLTHDRAMRKHWDASTDRNVNVKVSGDASKPIVTQSVLEIKHLMATATLDELKELKNVIGKIKQRQLITAEADPVQEEGSVQKGRDAAVGEGGAE